MVLYILGGIVTFIILIMCRVYIGYQNKNKSGRLDLEEYIFLNMATSFLLIVFAGAWPVTLTLLIVTGITLLCSRAFTNYMDNKHN